MLHLSQKFSPSPHWFITIGIGLYLACSLVVGHAFVADYARLLHLAEARYGQSGRQALQDWQRLLDEPAILTTEQKLFKVNDFINHRVIAVDDLQFWGQKDYWATPLESIGRGGGDCEDSAFAKYISLLQLGVAEQKMRLIYVRAQVNGAARAHMVLGYYSSPEEEPLILDSLYNEILPASARSDLLPIYSFNASGLWIGGNSVAAASPSAHLSNWRSVLERMQTEGWR